LAPRIEEKGLEGSIIISARHTWQTAAYRALKAARSFSPIAARHEGANDAIPYVVGRARYRDNARGVALVTADVVAEARSTQWAKLTDTQLIVLSKAAAWDRGLTV
jgi:hypothetical protein